MPSIHNANKHTPSNPKVEQMVQHLAARADASIDKALRHLANPGAYPVRRQAASLESALVEGADLLDANRRARLIQAAQARVAAPPMQVMGINFASASAVEEQVRPSFAGIGDVRVFLQQMMADWPHPGGTAGAAQGMLELRAHRLRCVKETREWGKDEIDLAGQATAMEKVGSENVKQVQDKQLSPFRVGSFNTNDVKDLGLRTLFQFPTNIGEFPRAYLANLVLVEKDHGSADKIRDLLGKLKKAVEDDIVKWLKDINLPAPLNLLVEALARVVPKVLAAIVNKLAAWLGDDIFDPAAVTISLPSADAGFPGGGSTTAPATVTFGRNSARYELTYDWRLIS